MIVVQVTQEVLGLVINNMWRLLSRHKNYHNADMFLKSSVKPFYINNYETMPNYQLLQSVNKVCDEKTVCLILERENANSIAFKASIRGTEILNKSFDVNSYIQLSIYRSEWVEHQQALKGFSLKFVDSLLNKHHLVIPNEYQNDSTKRFWIKRLLEAYENHHSIFYIGYNQITDGCCGAFNCINNEDEFHYCFSTYWGNSNQKTMFIISKNLKQVLSKVCLNNSI